MTDHERYHYSITFETDHPEVVHCLRALCQFAEKAPNAQIGWGGTGEKEWRAAGNTITLRFTQPQYRDSIVEAA